MRVRRSGGGDGRRRPGRRRAPDTSAEHVRSGSGGRLWFQVAGTGERGLVIPCTGNDADFAGVAWGHGPRVVYDVRNRGRSDPVDDPRLLGVAAEVSDLEAVRSRCGLARMALLGWSYHAGVAVTYALTHPGRVERLVLAAAVPPRSGAPLTPAPDPAPARLAELDQLDAAGARDRDPEAYCTTWRAAYLPPLMGRPEAIDRFAPVCHLPNEWPWRVARSLSFAFAELASYDWRPALRDLAVPTLVVHGGHDRYEVDVAAEWVDALPDARLLVVEEAGQFPWVEVPEVFFPTVNRFLAGERV